MAWYVVHVGKEPGVYSNWAEAHAQVHGFKGNCYKKYNTRHEALQAFYGQLHEEPPLLQPVDPALIENDGHVHNPVGQFVFILVFILVIVVVIALVLGFVISKFM